MTTTNRILGLDGGGTKTDLAVVDATGAVIHRQMAQGLDPTAGDGWQDQLAALAATLVRVDAAVLGLPYHGEIPAISARQSALGVALFGPNCAVVNDVAVAFEGAFAGADGVLILSGTGSMAWARGPAGVIRVGGWGDAFGDEGSAYWIGREALASVSRHLDGRQDSAAFSQLLLQRLGIAAADLSTWTYGQSQPRVAIAAVARQVSALADSGVPQARALMQAAAAQLAALGHTAARLSGAMLPLRWSVAGSVLQDATVLQELTQKMGHAPIPPRLPPVAGAVLAAARRAGWAVNAAFIDRLATTITRPCLQTKPAVQTARSDSFPI